MANILDLDATLRAKEVDDGLYVVFDTQRGLLVVHDARAPGGPKHSIVMFVQNEDGSFRPFDSRTIEHLRRIKYKVENEGAQSIIDELDQMEVERKEQWDKRTEEIAAGFADDIKYAGKDVVPSTSWRDRADPPAQVIRGRLPDADR